MVVKIGLSLSNCIKDMIEGTVDPAEVVALVTGTKIVTEDDWAYVLAKYGNLYWQANPELAGSLLRNFRDTGRIIQPRTNGQQPSNIARSHWIDLDDYQQLLRVADDAMAVVAAHDNPFLGGFPKQQKVAEAIDLLRRGLRLLGNTP